MRAEARHEMWDDEIDLRALVAVLLRRKWLIIGLTALAVTLAAIVSFFILPPTYESTVVLQLPEPGRDTDIGMTQQAFSVMALSPSVLRAVASSLPDEPEIEPLSRTFKVKLEDRARLLHVTSHGASPSEAKQKADLWLSAFLTAAEAQLREQVQQRLAAAEQAYTRQQEIFEDAQRTLREFEAAHPLNVLKARLNHLETEYARAQAQLEELTMFAIPQDEELLAFLETEIQVQSRTLELDGQNLMVFHNVTPSGASSASSLASTPMVPVNPVFLQLNEKRVATSERLTANKALAASLESFVETAPSEMDELRAEVARLALEEQQLRTAADTAAVLLSERKSDYLAWLTRAASAEVGALPVVVSEPTLPQAPVAPRKMLNIALAAFLAMFVGVGAAFFMEMWHDGDRRET